MNTKNNAGSTRPQEPVCTKQERIRRLQAEIKKLKLSIKIKDKFIEQFEQGTMTLN